MRWEIINFSPTSIDWAKGENEKEIKTHEIEREHVLRSEKSNCVWFLHDLEYRCLIYFSFSSRRHFAFNFAATEVRGKTNKWKFVLLFSAREKYTRSREEKGGKLCGACYKCCYAVQWERELILCFCCVSGRIGWDKGETNWKIYCTLCGIFPGRTRHQFYTAPCCN